MPPPIRTAQVRYDTFAMRGGLDEVTPVLSLPPGVARSMQNFEASVTGGYTRVQGYERFDGRPAPSEAGYYVVGLDNVFGLAVGNTVQNLGATVTAVIVGILGTALVLSYGTGTFTEGDDVYLGAALIGTVQAEPTGYAPTERNQAEYQAGAADLYRADITEVPGTGPVLGVLRLDGVTYAWRTAVGGASTAIHKSSGSGWQPVALGSQISFDTGTGAAIQDGDTISNLSGSATAVVSRVVLESGLTWSGGSGRLILSSVTGTWAPGDQIRVGGVQRATATSAATAITLAPNGRVQTVIGNVAGYNGAVRAYGCDNVNPGFEFDGTVYVPISTGMAVDTPQNVAVHKNVLVFSFEGSIQHSGVGTPYSWSPILGAAEIALPGPVTALAVLPGGQDSGALGVQLEDASFVLYGSPGAWNLVSFNRGVGSAKYSVQVLQDLHGMDRGGVISMRQAQEFGNFGSNYLTYALRVFIQARRGLVTASAINRDKSQYRVFFSDGTGLYITVVNGKFMGACPVRMPVVVTCWAPGEVMPGGEVSYFGGDDGYVYAMDSGIDHDGVPIEAFFWTNYASQGNARMLKRYRRSSLEVAGEGYAEFDFGFSLAYGTTDVGQPLDAGYETPFQTPLWDNFAWDSFSWDGVNLAPTELDCNGTGENIALAVRSNSRLSTPFTINTATLHYSVRRGIR